MGIAAAVLLALWAASPRHSLDARAISTTPPPAASSSQSSTGTGAEDSALGRAATTPQAATSEKWDSEAEDAWEKMLAEEEEERKRRYDELQASLPPSFERKIAECSLRADKIEAWVCSDRFVARLQEQGIPLSQAALDGLMWPDAPQATPDVTSTTLQGSGVRASLDPPRAAFMTPDSRRTRHNGQRVGEAPRAITAQKQCAELRDEIVKAACLKHFL
jgi:hypothetical protein